VQGIAVIERFGEFISTHKEDELALYTAKPEDGAVWITGASEGIGKAVARSLAGKGFKVYASARSADKLKALAESVSGRGEIVPLPLDVTDREACDKAVRKILDEAGSLSVTILNAGTYVPQRANNLKFEDFDKTLDVNVGGVLNGLLPSIDAMKQAGRGQIAIVASVAGYGGLPKNGAYGLSKAGLINLAETLKFDLDGMNIKMQVITPGFIDTPLTEKNDFSMPFLMDVDEAAKRVVRGLEGQRFEITFPRRFTYLIKLINHFAYPLYFLAVRKITGG
jgi:NADP-dependent 3-hydroxy acid dehydrogenase YdfG